MSLAMAEEKPKRKHVRNPKSPWIRRLESLRAKLGDISRAELAIRLGVAPRTVMYYELGKQAPSRSVALLVELLEQGRISP